MDRSLTEAVREHHSADKLNDKQDERLSCETNSAVSRRRAYSLHTKPRGLVKNCNNENSRRTSLQMSDLHIIESFLSVPKLDMSNLDETLENDSGDRIKRVRSFREKREKRDENLRRVRSFKTTTKGLINRGDSFKKNKEASHAGSTYYSGADSGGNSVYDTSRNSPVPITRVASVQTTTSVRTGSEHLTTHFFRVMLLGGPGVGKSSLIDQFMTSDFLGSGEFNISQSEDDRTVTLQVDGDESTLEFLQTEDIQERLGDVSIDAYIVVYSSTDRSSFGHVVDALECLTEELGQSKATILCANKTDLVRKRTISTEEGRRTADKYGCKYIETSAALNHRVDELLVGAVKQILIKGSPPVVNDDQGERLNFRSRRRKGSFKKTKQFLEKLFRTQSTKKDSKAENLYVG